MGPQLPRPAPRGQICPRSVHHGGGTQSPGCAGGNPSNYDYRDPRHVERYGKLVVRNPDGSTEGKHPRDADVDVLREIHEPAPLLRVIRAKCIDCSGGSESEARKCTAIGCALWPYRMASNPFRAPREMTPEQREAGAARLIEQLV